MGRPAPKNRQPAKAAAAKAAVAKKAPAKKPAAKPPAKKAAPPPAKPASPKPIFALKTTQPPPQKKAPPPKKTIKKAKVSPKKQVRFIAAPPPSALSERSKGRGRVKIPTAKVAEEAEPAKKAPARAPARAAPKAKPPPKPAARPAPPAERSTKAKLKECIAQLQQILNSM